MSNTSSSRPLSIPAVVSLVLAFILPPLGVVVGIVALVTLHGRRGRGLAIAAIVIGALFTALVVAGVASWVGFTEYVSYQ